MWYLPNMIKRSEGAQQRLRNKQLIIYLTEKLDKQYPNEGWLLISDGTNVGLENCDMDLYLFMLKVHMVYYPRSLKYMITYNIPHVIDDVVKSLMDSMHDELRNRVKLPKYKEVIDKYVDEKYVPSFFTRT